MYKQKVIINRAYID